MVDKEPIYLVAEVTNPLTEVTAVGVFVKFNTPTVTIDARNLAVKVFRLVETVEI